MKYIKFFESFTYNKLYHGTSEKHDFSGRGYITDGTFLATDINVAKMYGKYVYEVTTKDIKIFDPLDIDNATKLFNYFGELYDEWDDTYITDIDEFRNHSDIWNPIENTRGVLDWIRSQGYRGVRIIEGGSEDNVLLFYPNEDIMEYKLLH